MREGHLDELVLAQLAEEGLHPREEWPGEVRAPLVDGKGAQRGRELESVLVTVWHAVESDKGRGAAVADHEMVELLDERRHARQRLGGSGHGGSVAMNCARAASQLPGESIQAHLG